MSVHSDPPLVLVVDDDEPLRRALTSLLAARQYRVRTAGDADSALEAAADEPPDLVILDLAMPGRDGFDVCRELRAWLRAPILVLSVREDESDKIRALDLGADDYLTKPFAAGELLARVRALLRRAALTPESDPIVTVDRLTIDVARRRVKIDGQPVRLTRTEFEILAYLAMNANRVVTSRMILQNVWGPAYVDDVYVLRVHIVNLRKKIEPEPSVPRYILTETSVGYQFSTGE